MDKKLKRALDNVYRAPAPIKKAAFLKQHRRRELGRWDLVAVQAGHVRWWTWGASLAVLAALLALAQSLRSADSALWSASALTPFLALLAVMENGRAKTYRMEELELACRVPRQSVFLARMAALGSFHLALLAGLTPALAAWGAVGAVRVGVYLLTPYLLTAALGMELTRRVDRASGTLACGGAAALVGLMAPLTGRFRPQWFWPQDFPLWLGLLAGAAAALGAEIVLDLKHTEEISWN